LIRGVEVWIAVTLEWKEHGSLHNLCSAGFLAGGCCCEEKVYTGAEGGELGVWCWEGDEGSVATTRALRISSRTVAIGTSPFLYCPLPLLLRGVEVVGAGSVQALVQHHHQNRQAIEAYEYRSLTGISFLKTSLFRAQSRLQVIQQGRKNPSCFPDGRSSRPQFFIAQRYRGFAPFCVNLKQPVFDMSSHSEVRDSTVCTQLKPKLF